MRLFVFGLGFAALAAARAAKAAGWQVAGTTTSREKAAILLTEGLDAWFFDGTQPLEPEGEAILRASSHVLGSIPPSAAGVDPALHWHKAALQDLARQQRQARALYFSTTGVYGDTRGAVVTEDSPLNPGSDRARARVLAEQGWAATGLPLLRFRLTAIYGPGRSALERILAGERQRWDRPGQRFARIHTADIAAAVGLWLRGMLPAEGALNLADAAPAEPQAVTAYGCRLLGVPVPALEPFDPARLSPMARSFWAESRLVASDRLRGTLRLSFPSYVEGLRDCLQALRPA